MATQLQAASVEHGAGMVVPNTPWSRFQRFIRSENAKGYLFISPWIFGFIVFGLAPLINTIYNSFTSNTLLNQGQWIGTENYNTILTADPVFTTALQNMVLYVFLSTLITIGGGLLFSTLLQRDFRFNHAYRVIIYVPTLLVGVGSGMMFKQIFNGGEYGLANIVLGLFGQGPVKWLNDFDKPWLSIVTAILVNIWFTGGAMLVFLAGLKGISPTYYEAARIDGAGAFRSFVSVTLPLLAPVLVYNTIMTLIGHIQMFDTALVFSTSGNISSAGNPLGYHNSLATFLTYIYVKGFLYRDFGYACALAVIVFGITLLLTMLVLWVAKRFTYYGDQDAR